MMQTSKRPVQVEVCVDTFDGCIAALEGGAHRIELCASLSEGGLTPSAGLMKFAADLPIPVFAMIRPRSGLFHFTDAEADMMRKDIQVAGELGLDGVVLGAQTADNRLDVTLLARLCAEASALGKTLHRVIDVLDDPITALDDAIDLGFERILTSGAQPFAQNGVALIARMVRKSGASLSIMPGCGLDHENAKDVILHTGAREIHAACRVPAPNARAFSDFDPPGGRFVTSSDMVHKLVRAVEAL